MDAVLDEIAAAGFEKVLAIHLSGGLSGTYNLVRLHAAERSDLEAAVFDSSSGSLAIGSMLLQAWEDILAGMTWEELTARRVPALIANTWPYFSIDTLEYLQKGGRIGKVTALAGTMLNIKPVIGFAPDGQLVSVAKVRGRKAVQPKLEQLLAEKLRGHARYNLAVANGGAPDEMASWASACARRSERGKLLGGRTGRHAQHLYRRGRARRVHPAAGLSAPANCAYAKNSVGS